jgi:hypothetical protein
MFLPYRFNITLYLNMPSAKMGGRVLSLAGDPKAAVLQRKYEGGDIASRIVDTKQRKNVNKRGFVILRQQCRKSGHGP